MQFSMVLTNLIFNILVRPMGWITSSLMGNDCLPESQHAQKGFFNLFGQVAPKNIHPRAGNSKVNGQMWPKFKVVRDFTPVLVTCKFDDHLKKVTIVSTTFSPL